MRSSKKIGHFVTPTRDLSEHGPPNLLDCSELPVILILTVDVASKLIFKAFYILYHLMSSICLSKYYTSHGPNRQCRHWSVVSLLVSYTSTQPVRRNHETTH
mmetsp:Transcript_4310/g.9628  ORF Transcript_4310/g.9628 Transcript_4310/m.9628 type:complete len:102 (+) Transcript_4310:695-1000(+)